MSSPVSQLDSSEARNTAIGAMSEGCPTRPRGVMAIMCFSYSLPTPIMPAARAPSVAVAPGLIEFTRICLAKELGPRQIRVNSINPGATATEGARAAGIIGVGSDYEKQMIALTPLGRVGQPSDIAPIAVFLASDESSWLTGELISASGGWR